MNMIDLRSDTVTLPTPEMRVAIANAPVGDDVYGEDPTVNALEAEAAAMLGKAAGLFVASGTQGNLVALLTHCTRGDEIILAKRSHIFVYEVASAAAYGGIQFSTLDINHDGTMELDAIRKAIRPSFLFYPPTRLVVLENTQAGAHGAPLTAAYTAQVAALCREHDLLLHIDGARLFNAAVALDTTARRLVEGADSVSICLSKGLCAPVGSVLAGSEDFIHRARRVRKSLGGGMRQAGILAAAGLIALREMVERLRDDHATARLLGEGLATIPGISIDLSAVRTNMVFFDVADDAPITPEELSQRLKDDFDILIRPYDPRTRTMRAVTHYWIKPEHVERTVEAIRAIMVSTGEQIVG